MPKQEEGEDDNPCGREGDCGSAECEPEGRSGTPRRREAPPDYHPCPARAQLCKKSDDCARAQRKSLLIQRQARRSSTTCPTPSVDQRRLEVRTAEALLVPARNSIATEATVQTELAKGATTRRRRMRWRTTLVTSLSSPKPKITISTAVERCTTCII